MNFLGTKFLKEDLILWVERIGVSLIGITKNWVRWSTFSDFILWELLNSTPIPTQVNSPLSTHTHLKFCPIPGFHTSFKNIGEGIQNLIEGAWVNTQVEHERIQIVLKNTCERVHLLVKLLDLSLQDYKFTKNELLHIFFKDFN